MIELDRAAASSRAAIASCSSRCIDSLLNYDPYLVFADFQSYAECQRASSATYRDRTHWTRMSILNAARSGKFSSDRTIREYCDDIWRVQAVPIQRLQSETQHDFEELTPLRAIAAL